MNYSHYTYIVPIPYGSTVTNKKIHLTLPSQLAIETALRLYKNGKKIILCGDESFDVSLYKDPVTTHLMEAFLLSQHVKEDDIFSVGKTNKNTVQQLAAVAAFQKEQKLTSIPFLTLCLPYHKKRIEIHAQAYGLNTKTVTINEVNPNLLEKDLGNLFDNNFEPTEKTSRILSNIDKRGYYSNFVTYMKGPRIVDLVKGRARLIWGRTLQKQL